MSPVHGRRVVGDDAYDKAVREEVGGAQTFGVRVRGAIPESGPTNIAKRATEHGPLVVSGAKFQDHKGNETDGVSVEDIRNILAENPTFFDSLYEAELAREDGAREDALAVFYEVERGIKGAMRADVMDEIQTLLGSKRQSAAANADRNKARLEQSRRQQQRMAENTLLNDADRVSALADRAENLQRVKDAQGDDQLTPISPFVEEQLKAIGEEQGLDVASPTSGAVVGTVPTKVPGPINPETQTAGARFGVPKAVGTGNGSTTTETDSPPAKNSTAADEEGDEPDPEVVRIRSMTVTQLEREAKKQKVELPAKGSGADGAVIKKDLVKAILTQMGKPTDEE